MPTNIDHKFIMLGGGILQIPMIQAAKKRGWKVWVIDGNPDAPGKNIADRFIPISISKSTEIIHALEKEASPPTLAGTCATDFTATLGSINDHFKLPGISFKQGKTFSNKIAMREALEKIHLSQPEFINTNSQITATDWIESCNHPHGYVIKPAQNMGARGVMYLPNKNHLAYAIEWAGGSDPEGQFILEKFIPAPEISVDSLVINGKVVLTGLADRHIIRKDNRYFIEIGHTLPGKLATKFQKKIKDLLQKVANAFSLDRCALKGDLRIVENEILIGELALRLSGGFMSTHTWERWSGKSLMDACLDVYSGNANAGLIEKWSKIESSFVVGERSLITTGGQLQNNLPLIPTNSGIDLLYQSSQLEDFLPDAVSNIDKIAHFLITGKDENEINSIWSKYVSKIPENFISIPEIDEKSLKRLAKKKFNQGACWVCNRGCDGQNCASGVPGMGGAGNMSTFQDNIEALKSWVFNLEYIVDNEIPRKPDTRWKFANSVFSAPILTAPITGSKTNMRASITEWGYAMATGRGAVSAGMLPTFGDGATFDKYLTGIAAIETLQTGIPIFKPRPVEILAPRIKLAWEKGALAWGIDIDGIYFKTMRLKNQQTNRLRINDLATLKKTSPLPFIVKGVMNIADFKRAVEAGAEVIIISNHGGRVLESMSGTARVLPQVSKFRDENSPQTSIWIDGGIRSGHDVIKMLLLGAEAVLIGRPIAIAAVGLGMNGVWSYLERLRQEMLMTMHLLGMEHIYHRKSNFLRRSE